MGRCLSKRGSSPEIFKDPQRRAFRDSRKVEGEVRWARNASVALPRVRSRRTRKVYRGFGSLWRDHWHKRERKVHLGEGVRTCLRESFEAWPQLLSLFASIDSSRLRESQGIWTREITSKISRYSLHILLELCPISPGASMRPGQTFWIRRVV